MQNIDPAKIRSILVEVDLVGAPAAGSADFSFGSVPQLRDCAGVIGAEVFNATLQTKGPSNKTNMPDAAYKTAFLSFLDANNTEIRARIPAAKLIRANGNTAIEKLNLFGNAGNAPFDPQRSKLIIGDCALIAGSAVALIEFVYVAK